VIDCISYHPLVVVIVFLDDEPLSKIPLQKSIVPSLTTNHHHHGITSPPPLPLYPTMNAYHTPPKKNRHTMEMRVIEPN
jgi:hypothetical protein